jgi:two-component system chemotaxis response regulator CheB
MSAIRHVPVDHRCRLGEMARLMVVLAQDDPPASLPADRARLTEIENRIAQGIFNLDDWWELEHMSAPSGLNCPHCGSALFELNDPRILRFRCRAGHAFSALSLLSGQAEARETRFSSIFATLADEATLARRLLGLAGYGDDAVLAAAIDARLALLQREAAQVCEWLQGMAGLVEPDPGRDVLGERVSTAIPESS